MSWLVLIVENLLFPVGTVAIVLRFLLSPRRRVLLSLREELRERFGGVLPSQLKKLEGRRVLWVHAASAGEVAAVSGLLERIKSGPTPPAVILTTTTMTGREKAGALACADAVALAPLDCYPAVARFLDRVKPAALLLVETELWPQTIALAASRSVRIALVNGRMTDRSFGRYRRLSAGVGPFLRMIKLLAVQTEADALRYRSLGAEPSSLLVAGNMKYDRLKPAAKDPEIAARLSAMGWHGAPVWVAGSTHPIEEERVLEAFIAARVLFPRLRLVLAPRHPERAKAVAESIGVAGLSFENWSKPAGPPLSSDVLLVDVLGVLPRLYPFAAFSFVGGTMVPVGGHNLLEPCVAQNPVLFGPHTEHTDDVARLLESSGCGFRAQDADQLGKLALDLLSDPVRLSRLGPLARRTAESLQGAVERSLDFLAPVIFQ